MICEDVERDLDPYVDRELDEAAAAAIRGHLETCGACRARVADRLSLGRALRAGTYYTAPPRLHARVRAQDTRPSSTRRLTLLAAAAVLVVSVSAGATIWLGRAGFAMASSNADAVAGETVSAHVRAMAAGRLFDVESTDQHTVKPWFQGKLDFSPPVTDLARVGFPLVGGRIDYLEGHPVAALVYRRQQHTIDLFVWPAATRSTAATRTIRGFHVLQWNQEEMTCWAVSDLNEQELADFARAIGRR